MRRVATYILDNYIKFWKQVQGVPSELRLGFVDLDFECSTVCPTLLGLMGIWQKRLGMMVEHRFQSTQPMSQLTWDTL